MKNLLKVPQFAQTLNKHRTYLQQWITESNDTESKAFAIFPHAEHCGCQHESQ